MTLRRTTLVQGPPGPGAVTGTGSLVNGVSVALTSNISASSRIVVTRKDVGSSTAIGTLSAPSASRVVGTPGTFVVTSLRSSGVTETNDQSTFDWYVIG